MKRILITTLLNAAISISFSQSNQGFDIFTYRSPAGFTLKEGKDRLFYEKIEGKAYCQLYLWPAITGTGDADKNFEKDWNDFAATPYNVKKPETKDKNSSGKWTMVLGGAKGTYKNIKFVISISTFTTKDLTYTVVAVFNDQRFLRAAQNFTTSVVPDINKFTASTTNNKVNQEQPAAGKKGMIARPNTNFDDGWYASALTDYVKLTKNKTEIRLYYADKAFDDAKSNLIDVPEYCWAHYVLPGFSVSSPRKWSGVDYPIIYFMEGQAVEKQTGRSCYVAIKVVQNGGSNVIMSITPDENSFKQQFPHPDDMNRMLGYNKFAITDADLLGKWKAGTGGGLADYYNVYSGNYAYTVAFSSSDDFEFNTDKTYHSEHNNASTNAGGTTFSGVKYKGNFSTTDWELFASNRVGGKTKNFHSQFVAVKGGFLLRLTDSEYEPLVYTLFRIK